MQDRGHLHYWDCAPPRIQIRPSGRQGGEPDGANRGHLWERRNLKSSWLGGPVTSGRTRWITLAAMNGSSADLEAVTARLERIAAELDAQPSEERAAELVREASQLAAQAGRAVEVALQGTHGRDA